MPLVDQIDKAELFNKQKKPKFVGFIEFCEEFKANSDRFCAQGDVEVDFVRESHKTV